MKAELLVKQTEEDQETTKKNQELVRSMSPAELGDINSFSDFPVPSFGSGKREERTLKSKADEPPKTMYERLPQSWREQQLQVRAVEDDQEYTKQNQEAVKSKSVAELSEMTGLSDFPIPEVIENVFGTNRRPRPVERKKKFREM